jgi:glutamate racemase
MIGLFDTGHGGLTIYQALAKHLPERGFVYFGDHARAPYGTKPASEILDLTKAAIEMLFAMDCRLVVLACNTATAVALRSLQQNWLPHSPHKNKRVLGIIVPTVEVATSTHADANEMLAVFGTTRTIESGVYDVEIHKRNPLAKVVTQICPQLAGAIEAGASEDELERQVQEAIEKCLMKTDGKAPNRAILGCTHFPIVEHLFRKHLPPATQILSQGDAVADRLYDYLLRHPEFEQGQTKRDDIFLTSGDAARVKADTQRFLGMSYPFETSAKNAILS